MNNTKESWKVVAAMKLCGMTYKAIGKHLNIPPERARQWCTKGLNEVRKPGSITQEIADVHLNMPTHFSTRQAEAFMADAYLNAMFDFPPTKENKDE